MTILKTRQNTYETYAEGQERDARGNRRGELVNMPAFAQAPFDKKVYTVSIGGGTTPVSFVKTTYDADQPQLVIDVPVGKTIIPLQVMVMLEDSAGTDTEIIWGVSGGNVGAGTSTAASTYITGLPRNHYIPSVGAAPASNCSVFSIYSGNGADITDDDDFMEVDRWVYAFADTTLGPVKGYKWTAQDNPTVVINGTGSLVFWIVGASTAPAGFIRVSYWEADSDNFQTGG